MIITLSGVPGAGKSTIKALLAERLGYKAHSMGDMRGEMAKARGLTIDELNTLGMNEIFTDQEADEFQAELGRKEDNFVIDGWLSWHFIPQSFKVFLTVDPLIGAERIFTDRKNNPKRADEPHYQSVAETLKILESRVKQTDERYQKWYQVQFLDPANYDLVIDTSSLTDSEVLGQILGALPKA
jgi:predicted cytidylate kinase